MLHNRKWLVLQQLEKTLSKFASLKSVSRPPKGWLCAVRGALGMSGTQFAERLGVTPPRVSKIEKDELSGAVTIRTMKQAAEALDSVFVYALVPRESLKIIVKEQAKLVAVERLGRVSNSMKLEDQQLSKEEMKKVIDAAVEELVHTMPKDLWNIR